MRKLLLLILALCLSAQARVSYSSPTLIDQKPRYSIKIVYPQIALPQNLKAQRAINGLLAQDAQKLAADFRKSFAEESADMSPEIPNWTLEASFEVAYETPDLLVIRQSGYDYRGGAHGMPILDAFTFDLDTGKRLTLSDWYNPGYLEILSQVTRARLQADKELVGDPGWIITGTKPDANNFPVVYPIAGGMLVVFPPYQVAAYVSGMPEVLVPYSKLAPVAKPGTPTRP